MFSFISVNWKGHLLVSHMSIVNLKLTRARRAMMDLRIEALLCTPEYEAGVKVSNAETEPNESFVSQLHPSGS